MRENNVAVNNKKPRFSMKMPDWFIELNPDEKKRIVNRIKNESINFLELSDEDLRGLLRSAKR